MQPGVLTSCSPSSLAASQASSGGGELRKPARKGVVLGKDKYIIESRNVLTSR